MSLPSTQDTIVAVSTGWQPSRLGIVRLSGPESFELAAGVGVRPAEADGPAWTAGRLCLDEQRVLPVATYWFGAPRSYTGQDVVELHTVGCLPLLRELAARLIELGARRALPGEFTARAFLNKRLAATQVEGVLALMQAGHEVAARQAARLALGVERRACEKIADDIVALLALIEADIDFFEEEDVRFIAPDEVVSRIDTLVGALQRAGRRGATDLGLARPHIALAGLPNAGKSTLFNRLLGYERALVSPVLGTTRDVLCADIQVDGLSAVLQDCAGAGGGSADELELACHLASERAAEAADLVLWVHAADMPWDARETAACARITPERRLLAWSKADLLSAGAKPATGMEFAGAVAVSAAEGTGIAELRGLLAAHLRERAPVSTMVLAEGEYMAVAAALGRARLLAAGGGYPELIAIELREAQARLATTTGPALDEQLLGRIFSMFCVGK